MKVFSRLMFDFNGQKSKLKDKKSITCKIEVANQAYPLKWR